jgi:hypothetical protein
MEEFRQEIDQYRQEIDQYSQEIVQYRQDPPLLIDITDWSGWYDLFKEYDGRMSLKVNLIQLLDTINRECGFYSDEMPVLFVDDMTTGDEMRDTIVNGAKLVEYDKLYVECEELLKEIDARNRKWGAIYRRHLKHRGLAYNQTVVGSAASIHHWRGVPTVQNHFMTGVGSRGPLPHDADEDGHAGLRTQQLLNRTDRVTILWWKNRRRLWIPDLLTYHTARARQRLTFAKGLKDRLVEDSPLSKIEEQELFRVIAEQAEQGGGRKQKRKKRRKRRKTRKTRRKTGRKTRRKT